MKMCYVVVYLVHGCSDMDYKKFTNYETAKLFAKWNKPCLCIEIYEDDLA